MKVSIRYYAILKKQAGKIRDEYFTDGPSVRDLYLELRQRYHFTLTEKQVKVAVNEQFEPMSYLLKPEDRIVFIPPVAGG